MLSEGDYGPVHELCDGRYIAEIRAGRPMIRRADSAGAVLAIEWESEEDREAWEEAIRADERERMQARDA